MKQLMTKRMIVLLTLSFAVLLVGCPLVTIKMTQTTVLDQGDGTRDEYQKEEVLSDKDELTIEAELIK